MKITKKEITIKQLTEGYVNNNDEGVVGFGGKLDIRPPYQREFIYKPKQRDEVIRTVLKGHPLNIMYWNVKADGTFEVLDGQQRTISICEYAEKNFGINEDGDYYNTIPKNKRKDFDNYILDIYQCEGTDEERIDWFQVINIAGEILMDQEILNAIYAGPWTIEAKKIFSKRGCRAYDIGNAFMPSSKRVERQDYLETAIKWINNGKVKDYMAKHFEETNADELWLYFQSVMNWVQATFITEKEKDYRKEMKNVNWGELYNTYSKKKLDSKKIQARVSELFTDRDITKLSGIYPYVLSGLEKHLSIRAFEDSEKRKAYEKQKGICANKKNCPRKGKKCTLDEMHADHITPWSKGGKTLPENCQMLCADCNRRKGNI